MCSSLNIKLLAHNLSTADSCYYYCFLPTFKCEILGHFWQVCYKLKFWGKCRQCEQSTQKITATSHRSVEYTNNCALKSYIVWWFPKDLDIELLRDVRIPLPCIPKGWKQGLEQIWTPVFIAALFTIVKRWWPPKCPCTSEWINGMCCPHVVKCYSVS